MKKTLLLISFVFFVFSGFSQINWTWEADTAAPPWGLWQWSTTDPVVVENPVKTFYNMSDSVIQCKTGTSAWGWGYGASLSPELAFGPGSDTVFTIKILADVAAPILFKFEYETNGGINSERWGNYSTPGQWQELTFNLNSHDSTLTKFIFWFDPMVEVGTLIDFYLDDVIQEEGTIVMYEDNDALQIAWETFDTEPFDIVQNPVTDGINKSDSVGHAITGSVTWDGSYIKSDGSFDFSKNTVFTIDVYSEFSGTVLLKIENRANNQIFIENQQEYTTPGEWATLRFAFDTASVNLYEAMVIFFDFGGTTVGNDWYYDNIQGPPIVKEEWGVTVNLSVVDEMGISDLFADIWINPGEDYNDDDPNTWLLNMVLTDEDEDNTWTGSVLIPWTNFTNGVFVTNQYCLHADDEEYEYVCNIEWEQAAWDTEINLTATIFAAAVEDFKKDLTTVFPNPVADVLTISNSGNVKSVNVYSIIGQRVMSINNLESENLNINVSNLDSGVYMINLIENDGKVTTHKIIVK